VKKEEIDEEANDTHNTNSDSRNSCCGL